MQGIFILIVALILIVCALLGVIILIQNPKGGGLTASLGSVSNQILGASRSTDVVEKATWYLAVGLLVLSLASTALLGGSGSGDAPVETRTERVQNERGTTDFNPNAPVVLPDAGDGQPVDDGE